MASHADRAKPAGVMTSGSRNVYDPDVVRPWNTVCAQSAIFAKQTLMMPIPSAPAQKTSLGRQTAGDPQKTRERRKSLDFL